MLMIDLEIINFSNGENSLSTVMNELYSDYALKLRGYSEEDFINLCENYGGNNIKEIFNKHVYGTKDYLPTLEKKLEYVGLQLKEKVNPNLSARYFGFLAVDQENKTIIKKVEPNSEADKMGLAPEDEIIKINGEKIQKSLNEYLKDCKQEIYISVRKKFYEKEVKLNIGNYFILQEIEIVENKNEQQLRNFNFWTK